MISVARMGDPVSVCGVPGLIVWGSWNTLTNWRPTARVGDIVLTLLGPGIITSGSSRVQVNFLPAAHMGSTVKLWMGATGMVVKGSENTFLGI